MPANGHVSTAQQTSKSTAIVEINTLSEDNQAINPADHDGTISNSDHFFYSLVSFFRCNIRLFN
jgi:hypothetical protein